MIEGRSGGSGRGTPRESWAPPDSGSSTSGSYVVSCTDARPEPFTAPPSHFLPSAASSPVAPACWPREKFRRTQAHVRGGRCTAYRSRRQPPAQAATHFPPSAAASSSSAPASGATIEKFRPHPSHVGSAPVPIEWGPQGKINERDVWQELKKLGSN